MFRHGVKPVIGLIGAIGAGKSWPRGASRRGADGWLTPTRLGHDALRQPEIMARVVERLGDRVRKPDGSLDRRASAESSSRIRVNEPPSNG